jgi:small GTP-binding protein
MALPIPEVEHKVVFLGDSNTGKTSIMFKYLKLAEQPFPTIAPSSVNVRISVHDSAINMVCWDTAGQECYRSLVRMYTRDAEVACLVFNQANRQSFESLPGWLDYIQSDVSVKNVIVVSNKNDLEPVVPLDEAFEFCTERKLPLVATSALTGSNITFLFIKIAQMIFQSVAGRVQREDGVRIAQGGIKNPGCC